MDTISRRIIVKLLHVVTTVSLLFGLSPAAGRAAAAPTARSDGQPSPSKLIPEYKDLPDAVGQIASDRYGRSPLSYTSSEWIATAEPLSLQAGLPYSHTLFFPLVMQTRDAGPKAEITLHKWAEPWLALPGDVVTYTLVVSNTGELAVPGGVLVDHVPEQLTVLVAQGAAQATGQGAESGELRWSVAPLDPGQAVTVTFQAWVADDVEMAVVQNSATFTADPDSTAGVPRVTAVATATLLVGEATVATLTPAGGQFSLAGLETRPAALDGAL
jgi:uncharacterized repeat protein (TIGR01451 family)